MSDLPAWVLFDVFTTAVRLMAVSGAASWDGINENTEHSGISRYELDEALLQLEKGSLVELVWSDDETPKLRAVLPGSSWPLPGKVWPRGN